MKTIENKHLLGGGNPLLKCAVKAVENDSAVCGSHLSKEITTSHSVSAPRNDEPYPTTSRLSSLFKMTFPVVAFAFVLSFAQIGETYAKKTCNCGKVNASDCCWEIVNNKLIISGTGDMKDYVYPANSEWFNNTSITSIEVQEGITGTGWTAFNSLTNAVSIKLPDTLTSINSGLLYNGSKIKSLQIPDSVVFVGADILQYNNGKGLSIEEIIIPDSWGDELTKGNLTLKGTMFQGIPANTKILCRGELEKCQAALEKFKPVSEGGTCTNYCISPNRIQKVNTAQNCTGKYFWDSEGGSCNRMNETQCNDSGKYYYTGSSCANLPSDLSKMTCNSGYVLDETAHRCDRHGCASFADGACTCDKYYYKKEGGCVSFEEGCGSGWLEKNRECIEASKGCGAGYKNMGGWCNRVIYTPAEAAEVLDDENNMVTITFRK